MLVLKPLHHGKLHDQCRVHVHVGGITTAIGITITRVPSPIPPVETCIYPNKGGIGCFGRFWQNIYPTKGGIGLGTRVMYNHSPNLIELIAVYLQFLLKG